MLTAQKFQFLFWFVDANGNRYQCYKTEDDEVYVVYETSENNWVRSEKYMSRNKYENFLSGKGII